MNEENDKTKDIDEVVADTEKSDSLEEPDVNDAEEDLEEEQDDDLEDESEPAPEGLHALDFTPSESSTTNIPPRLPEGFSYNQTQPTVTRKKSKKKLPKVAENVVTVDTDKPLRSEPSTVRSRKYRTHHPNRAMLKAQLWWSRYKWWATGGVVVLAMGVTYPFWGERLGQLMQPKEETPVVAADTILPTKDTILYLSLRMKIVFVYKTLCVMLGGCIINVDADKKQLEHRKNKIMEISRRSKMVQPLQLLQHLQLHIPHMVIVYIKKIDHILKRVWSIYLENYFLIT